ncbi:hypothetical protein GCM10007148_04380 [Parvularcula lutaonensis]|nr:hypothetical protein GCM10007148_04380 [Parvularcula lutaonensis]
MPQAEVTLAWGFSCQPNGPRPCVASITGYRDRCNPQHSEGAACAGQFPHETKGTGMKLSHAEIRPCPPAKGALRV